MRRIILTSTILTAYAAASTTVACTGSLSQSDTDDSFANPCPQYFSLAHGALSGSSLTVYGLPALVDFSGSYITSDGTSTTYALTCQSSDVAPIIASQCTSSGVVVPFTASGWNWHIASTWTDRYQTADENITATINSSGMIAVWMVSTVTDGSSSPYTTTNTWTGNVAIADPSVVPIAGLPGISAASTSASGHPALTTPSSVVTAAASTAASPVSSAASKGAAAYRHFAGPSTFISISWAPLATFALASAFLAIAL